MRNSLFFKRIGLTVIALMILIGSTAPALSAQDDGDQTDVKGLVVALSPTGFLPAEVELQQGRYLFIVQNRSGIRDLTFQLDSDTDGRVHEDHNQKPQWKKRFDLHPGTYVLSVVDHPSWRSVITVTPR